MHEQTIIDRILSELDIGDCKVKSISLIADETNLKRRIMGDIGKGIRAGDATERSVDRIPLYENLNTIKIDTNGKTIQMISDEIKKL